MDSARSLAATAAAAPVSAAAAARQQADTANDASTFFANLLQKVSNQFMFNPSSIADPTAALPTVVAPQEKNTPDPHDDQAAQVKDDKVNDANDKKNAAADDKAASAKDSAKDAAKTDTAATTPTVTDPNLSAQLSALQALLLTQQQTAAPVVEAAPVVVVQAAAAPEVVAPVTTNTAPVVDPTTQAAPITAPTTDTATQAQTPVTPQEILAAQVQAAATVTQAPVAVKTAAPTTQTASNQPQLATLQTATQDTPDTTTVAPTTDVSLPKSVKAQSQSEAISKLLGDTNTIRVAVTVDTPKTVALATNVYDHFSGYSMGDNAGTSLANGQFGAESATNALVADQETTTPLPTVLTQATVAAAQTPVTTPSTTTTAAPTPRPEVASASAVTSVASSSASSEAESGLGQMGLGQPGPGSSNATNASSQTTQTNQPAATPAQVYEQIKVKITRATKAGLDEVSIQLKPEDLGRLDIKLQVSPEGKVHATVTADNQQTLTMLQNDAQGLERALNDAGLRADAGSLEFNLRGDGNASSGSQLANGSGSQNTGTAANDDTATTATFDYARAAGLRGGVDTYA